MVNMNNNKSQDKAQQKINTLGLYKYIVFNHVIVSHFINNNYLPCYNLTKVE